VFVKELPNILSHLRIVLTIFHIILMSLGKISPVASVILLFVVYFTDALDGQVARRFKAESKLGSILDVTGDRIAETGYWIFFGVEGLIPLWVPLLFFSRGVITDSFLSYARTKGYDRLSLNKTGLYWLLASSRASRLVYGAVKFLAIAFLCYGLNTPLTYLAAVLCVVRGVPIVHKTMKILQKDRVRKA
jgi:CDP-diacylglycerol--glycerol-3-phosphate 3-phosphatidyltransferase